MKLTKDLRKALIEAQREAHTAKQLKVIEQAIKFIETTEQADGLRVAV
jgi:hypothetical protein